MNRRLLPAGPVLNKVTVGILSTFAMLLVATESQCQEMKRHVKPNYEQAERYSSRYLRQFVYDSSVTPRWIGETDKFWYSYRTSTGTKYYRVDPKHATKEDLFDHAKLAAKLSELIRKPLDSARLPLSRVQMEDDGSAIKFVVEKLQYKYNLETEELEKLGKAPTQSVQVGRGGQRIVVEEKKEDDKKEEKDQEKKTDKKKTVKDTGKKDSGDKSKSESEEKKDKSEEKVDDKKSTNKSDKKSTDDKGDKKEKSGDKDKDSGDEKKKAEPKKKEQTDHRAFSPDRTAYVFAKGHDLYMVEIPEGYEYKSEDEDSESKKDDSKKDSSNKDAKKAGEKSKSEKADRDKDKKVTKTDDKDSDKEDSDKGKDKDGKSDEKSDKDKEDEEKKEIPIPKIGPDLDDTAVRLSEDGEEKFSFARRTRSRNRSTSGSAKLTDKQKEEAKKRKSRPSVSWSKDSKAFFISRRDSRNVKELFVINSLSEPRPTLETYSYSMPGEEGVSVSHFYYVKRDEPKLTEVDKKWKHESFRNAHWKRDGHQLRFVRSDRLLRNIEFCEMDIETGEVKCLIEDGFDAANIAVQSARYLKETDEMIWFSERSGWAHFYLYDLDGNLKNSITSGEFRASRIVDIDEKNRLVYFTGNGREAGENIYQNHLYCVRMDGTGLTLMDPGNANHRSSLSPSKKYVVDNCSRVDMAPISILRDAQGNEIMKLEESDMSRLTEVGWKMPDTFVVKAADGVTDLYGNIWKPFDFNPKKKYPVIAHVYPGPQTEGTSHTFSATSGNQQLAQLGFIVIQVGHRGGTPQRSKAYHSYGYFNLRDYGLADKKAAIEQLGQRFHWVDVERVGIYGHSGGGFMTAAALLREPYNDFFKVGVSTAGNHDNNIYNNTWSERYHGLKRVVGDAKESSRRGQRSSSSSTQNRGRSTSPAEESAYSAFSSEESDFFYENEGTLNEDGELEYLVDPLGDGPSAFSQDVDEKKKDEKSKVGKNSTEDADKEKSDKDGEGEKKTKKSNQKDKVRFEIEVPTNAELAANLKGHLFLIHGEADNNVHPANTLRLVDALIKENKRFDMLYLPATRHGFGRYQPYVTQRMYEYFAEHLLDDYQSAADLGDRE